MTTAEQKQVKAFFDADYKIMIETEYVDSFVSDISQAEDSEQQFVFTSETFDDCPLKDFSIEDVKIYKEVENFMELKPCGM